MRVSKSVRLHIKNGRITSIYDDTLVPLIGEAESVTTRRASHVEPDGKLWNADMSPVGGPNLTGFETREDALRAEKFYLEHELTKGTIE